MITVRSKVKKDEKNMINKQEGSTAMYKQFVDVKGSTSKHANAARKVDKLDPKVARNQ